MTALGCLAASCGTSQVYQPFETSMINHRSTLMLDATNQPPLPPEQSAKLVDSLEQRLLAAPDIGPAINRAEFHERFGGNFGAVNDFRVLSDNVSVAGLSDREQTARLGKATETEMLLGVQVFSVPCDLCVEGPQVAVVGQMTDTRTGVLVWRATLLAPVSTDAASVQANLDSLADDLVTRFYDALRPKWHRARFRNLSPRLANAPRPDIPLPVESHSGVYVESGGGVPDYTAPTNP